MSPRLTQLVFVLLFFSCSTTKKTEKEAVFNQEKRYLILTADDFGASKNINDGIKFAAEQNAITTISALSNFNEALPDLKEIADSHPEIGIGVHLNIITRKPFPKSKKIFVQTRNST